MDVHRAWWRSFCLFEGFSILDYRLSQGGILALHAETAQGGDRLRGQAEVSDDGDASLLLQVGGRVVIKGQPGHWLTIRDLLEIIGQGDFLIRFNHSASA